MRRLSTLSVPALALGTALAGLTAAPAEGGGNCAQPAQNCQTPNQSGNGSGGTVGATSDANLGAGFSIADNFSPAATGSVTSVCWYGFYIDFDADGTAGGPFDCGPGTGDQFNIRYFNNGSSPSVSGIPGSQIVAFQNVSITKTPTGNVIPSTIGDIVEYEYTATHNAVNVSAGECYWIEIENFTNGTCFWLWSSAPAGDNLSFQDVDSNGYQAAEAGDYDLAFCLNLELVPDLMPCQPPANDACANAEVVGDGIHGYDNSNATSSGPAESSCALGSAIPSDVWFRYVAQCNGTVDVEVNAPNDVWVAVYQNFCPTVSNTALDCGTGTAGFASASFAGTTGTTYYIRIGGDQGAGTLTISGPGCVPPPANDGCGNATAVTVGSSTPVNTAGATSAGPAEASCDEPQADVWYRIFSTCTEQLNFTFTGDDIAPSIAIYGAVCPGGPDTAIGCDTSTVGNSATVAFTPPGSGIYRIRVGSTNGATGTGTLDITCGTPAACPGDTNGDNMVDVSDLVNVILDWGTDGSGHGGDLAGASANDGMPNNIVDVADLVTVILNWGAACK